MPSLGQAGSHSFLRRALRCACVGFQVYPNTTECGAVDVPTRWPQGADIWSDTAPTQWPQGATSGQTLCSQGSGNGVFR